MCLKREALYARVSTDKQEREETVASQVDLLHQTAEAHGYEVLPGSVFIDDGISGARLDRPALDRLRDLVAEGVFEVILVTVPARLARRYAYQVALVEELIGVGAASQHTAALSNEPSHLPNSSPAWHTRRMYTRSSTTLYRRHRVPAELIRHGVQLSCLVYRSDRDVEALRVERRGSLTDEAVRSWGRICRQASAHQRRRRRPGSSDSWHLDEVLLPPPALSTTAPNPPSNRPASGHAACGGASCPATPSAFSPSLGPSRHPAARAAPGARPPRIARRWRNDCGSGEELRGGLLPHTCHAGGRGPLQAWA